MPPIIRNTFIRIVAFFDRIWNLSSQLLKQTFGFVSRLFGLDNSGYYLEEQGESKQAIDSQQPGRVELNQTQSRSSSSTASRPQSRRPAPEIDYFRNMAKQLREPK